MTKTKTFLKIFLTWLIVLAIFTFLSLWLILKAAGLRFNSRSFNFEKTSLVTLRSDPKEAEVFLNDKKVGPRTPVRLPELSPGLYDLKVTKEGYTTWQHSVEAKEGLAYDFPDILLFKKEPEIKEADDPKLSDFFEETKLIETNGQVAIKDNEIWYQNDELITRFSEPISNAILYPDEKHIGLIYQNNISVIDLDGTNLVKLIPLQSPEGFIFIGNGRSILFKDQSKLKLAKIR